MIRSATLILFAAALSGCENGAPEADWREGAEAVRDCLQRLERPQQAAMMRDTELWVRSYTYDITKLDPDALRDLIVIAEDENEAGTVIVALLPGASSQSARDEFADTPATTAGALLHADESSLYKVRGEPVLYRDVLRQGCEGQRDGKRLLSWRVTRESALVDGEIPRLDFSSSDMRRLKETLE